MSPLRFPVEFAEFSLSPGVVIPDQTTTVDLWVFSGGNLTEQCFPLFPKMGKMPVKCAMRHEYLSESCYLAGD